MVLSPSAVGALVTADCGPGERAIGGCVPSTGPYAVPLFGGAATQLPSSWTGAVAVTVGRFVMSAAVSERRIRTLALLKRRSAYSTGFVTFSPTGARRIRSGLVPP